MDINSLLSPSESPRPSSLTPKTQSPLRYVQTTHSGSAKESAANSPLARGILPPSSIPAHIRSPSHQTSQSSPLISPVPASASSSAQYQRPSSTQSMDTLADLASMQNHQSVHSTPPLHSRGSNESIHSLHRPSITSIPRSSFDIAMVETPRQFLRGDYAGTSLPLERQQSLAQLVARVQDKPSAYDAHIEIIKILHQGFVDHIYPSSNPAARRDPRSYDLLPELRQARESADKVFALGEEHWLDWLQDESILAQSAEDRVGVVEKCRRAVEEEHGSPRLWSAYGDWVLHCYNWAHDSVAEPATGLPDEERLVGRELFPWTNVIQVWDQAIEQTEYDISQSQLVWEKYLRVRFPHYEDKLEEESARQVLEVFQQRLQTPHAQWDSTFQAFSGFVSANFSNESYEQIMATTNQAAAPSKAVWSAREPFENAIAAAIESGDRFAEYQAFLSYIQWVMADDDRSRRHQKRRQRKDQANDEAQTVSLVNALFQRAELRIPSVIELWEDHVSFMIEKRRPDVSGVLSRATKHCPWSGSLWKQYLLTSEMAGESFQTIETIKHDATKTSMLDASGIEEVLKVHDAWCGYLVRRARRPDSTEEDSDVAEMGIRTSMEAVQTLASKLDLPSNFDASFRLQRKYVEYLKGQGRLDNARKQFDDALSTYGKHYRFWLRFYDFEMQKSLHINSLQQDSRQGVSLSSSTPFAVAILKQGLQQADLDYPEYLIEALINHCEDYEDAEELQASLLLVSKLQKQLTERRQREGEEAMQRAPQPQVEDIVEDRAETVATNLHLGKRKREDDEESDEKKKARGDDPLQNSIEQAEPSQEVKRDRENASIMVQHVPKDVSENQVRRYFTACGSVKGVKSLHDEDYSFIVEFDTADEAQYALSRNGQDFDGSIISVSLNAESTLYVTNYVAAADENYIRSIFSPYGKVVSIRFPSLQGNKRRRFCYVEFKSSDQAYAALALDGQEKDGLSLLVKISNPSAKKRRTDRQHDGRTIFVGQLPFKATEKQVMAAFSEYGHVDTFNMPRDPTAKSKNKGIAFITFQDAQSAQSALEMNGQEFQDRKLKVNMMEQDRSYWSSTREVNGASNSPAPKIVDAQSPVSAAGPSATELEDRRQRTIALCDVPDIVNEARIRAAAEAVGPVRKVILKTNHMGALVEYSRIEDAGKAAIELDGSEIAPGRKLRVTTEQEMLQQKPEKRVEKIGDASKSFSNIQPKRPPQSGARKGGHLGQRSAAIFKQPNGTGNVGGKTNDDFRAMLK